MYFLISIALAVLVIADFVEGVSNDAVNFLNSALGSKAISFRTIMIVASLGIACGAVFSSGLMVGSIALTIILAILFLTSYNSTYIFAFGITFLLFLSSWYARGKSKNTKIYS